MMVVGGGAGQRAQTVCVRRDGRSRPLDPPAPSLAGWGPICCGPAHGQWQDQANHHSYTQRTATAKTGDPA
jgi:hypothetical protein